jgi:hypothetical protein
VSGGRVGNRHIHVKRVAPWETPNRPKQDVTLP